MYYICLITLLAVSIVINAIRIVIVYYLYDICIIIIILLIIWGALLYNIILFIIHCEITTIVEILSLYIVFFH